MNKNEIWKFIDRNWRYGKLDFNSVLKSIELNDYKFNNNEILEIYKSYLNKIGMIATPNNLSELIVKISKLYNPKKIIDICCGSGNITNHFLENENIIGIDINSDVIKLAKKLNPKVEFKEADSLKYEFGNNKFDLVVGSLPFGAKLLNKKILEIELINKGLSILENNGIAIFVVPENLLTSNRIEFIKFRENLKQNFAIDIIVSLPTSIFYPFSAVKTSVLVIRKGKANVEIFMPMFQENAEEISNNYLTKKGDFYLPLKKLEKRFDRSYYLSVDIIQEKLKDKEVKKLSEIAAIIIGFRIEKELLIENGTYIVLNKKNELGNNLFINDLKNEKSILKPNDIVISLLSSERKIYIHSSTCKETVITDNYVIIRSKNSNYLNTFLQSKNGQDLLWEQVNSNKTGAYIQKINIAALGNILIPILPLSELNFDSADFVKNATIEQIKILENNLKTIISAYEPNSIHYNLSKEILSKIEIQLENSKRIEKKVDTILINLENLSLEILSIKKNKREDEEKISRIYYEIDEKLKILTKEKEKDILYYQSEIKKWLENWNLLHSSSSNFLTSAELIFDHLPNIQETDYSPFIIQYCRALENEILKKLFEEYHSNLKFREIDLKNLTENDLTNTKTQIFANNIRKNKCDYTLGTMSFIMNLLIEDGNTLSISPLLQNFRTFTLEFFEDRVLQKYFLNQIKNITDNFRNKSAHPYILSLETAKECQKIVREILIEFLDNIRK